MSEINEKIYNKLIPVVLGIPVFFLILFIVVSMIQLREINSRIEEGQSQTVKEMMNRMAPKDSLSEIHRQFLTLAVLEEESLSERYRQGHYSLVSRSFRQFLGFFTGIIMVIVGAVFVLLKLREKIDVDASKAEGWKFTLVTNSPGVVFGIVGAVLISLASTTDDKISVRDAGLYLTREYLVAPFFSEKGSQQGLNDYMKNQNADQETNDEDVIIQRPPSNEGTNEKLKSSTNKENLDPDEKLMIQRPPKK
jgi:hypothetical protein